jgi:hypothetical protein
MVKRNKKVKDDNNLKIKRIYNKNNFHENYINIVRQENK